MFWYVHKFSLVLAGARTRVFLVLCQLSCTSESKSTIVPPRLSTILVSFVEIQYAQRRGGWGGRLEVSGWTLFHGFLFTRAYTSTFWN
jgi:hypothetical protein